ncbi:MAG: iron ABC transporter permease [Actinomycetota bacterium]|nr:MAG: iron complex transport system permease [Actinomycetota bacterium]MDO8950232.1 iron ABC transporter permease [Actinomycetota bacterium]MDP3630654.1 iron ABC transporter permease [Actinomycetota bacterium]
MPLSAGSRARITLVSLAGALTLAVVAGVVFGAVRIPVEDVFGALWRALGGNGGGVGDAVIVDLRLPRVLLAALVGASLATAGVLYQALFRNALADPYILGVSSGAGLGATIALVAGGTSLLGRVVGVPLGAFVGALLTITLVVRLASRAGRLEATSLLLAGVAVSYTLAAVTSFIMVFARESMQAVVFWMMGGLTGASWPYVGMLSVMLAVGITAPLLLSRQLDLMLLGDERAGQLGLDVERFKLLALACASLMVAGAVSVSGLIGFVGLMTPHMVRLILGPNHRVLLPASALAGALVMVLSDLVARIVLAPVEIPVGIVTALAGGPFFVWLLVRKVRAR